LTVLFFLAFTVAFIISYCVHLCITDVSDLSTYRLKA